MAEYVMSEGENAEQVARELLEHAGDRVAEIHVYPRPNVPGGQVFAVPDDLADGFVSSRLSRIGDPSTEGTEGATTEEGDSSTRRTVSRAEARRAAKSSSAEANKE